MRPEKTSKTVERQTAPRPGDSVEDLRLHLEAAKKEAATQLKSAQAIDRLLAAAVTASSTNDLLRVVLEILVDLTEASMAVVRLCEQDQLHSRLSIGLDNEVKARFATSMAPAAKFRADPNLIIDSVPLDDPALSEHFRENGARAVYCLALRNGAQLLGLIYLGTPSERAFSPDDQRLLELLGSRSGQALARCLQHEALAQGVADRDQMLGVVAHDLRNPIGIISMVAATMQQRDIDPSLRRPLERIMRAAGRAGHLLRDLLEVNAIDGGKFSVQTQRVETASTILAAIDSQQGLAATASVILRSDVSPELPSVDADEERILEVLENLIGNAVKFTSAGGTVTVGASYRNQEVLVWVKDTGQGILTEQLPHLFDRFWQAKKSDRRGAGLGLTICKAIVEAHGGKIWAESTVGTGTTMFFTIPVSGAQTPKAKVPVVANILLVDDRPENLLSLKAILDRPDYRLITATSGEEALRLTLRETFSVALIDIAMPGMDGLEVAMHLKELERSRDVPIIFITAFGDDPQEVHRAYAAGGADYLVKPLDAEIVRKKVAVFVELGRRRSANEQLKSNES